MANGGGREERSEETDKAYGVHFISDRTTVGQGRLGLTASIIQLKMELPSEKILAVPGFGPRIRTSQQDSHICMRYMMHMPKQKL